MPTLLFTCFKADGVCKKNVLIFRREVYAFREDSENHSA